jgi:hypothetical protein
MPDRRSIIRQSGEKTVEKFEPKRKAPQPTKTKEQAAVEEREKLISRGVITRWRMHPDIAPAVRKAAERENVTQREFMEYIITAALKGLATGKLTLPKKQTGTIYSIDFQGIPEQFQE